MKIGRISSEECLKGKARKLLNAQEGKKTLKCQKGKKTENAKRTRNL